MEKNTKPTPILPTPGEEEIWKQHPIYTEYEVSTFGNVRRAYNQYVMTPTYNGRGYGTVHLRVGVSTKNGKYCRVHKLVAQTFHGVVDSNYEVDHLDRNIRNNYYKNLCWATHQENINNSPKTRRQKIYMDKPALVLLDKENNYIKEFKNLAEAIQETKIGPQSIRDCAHGRIAYLSVGRFMIKEEYFSEKEKNI